MTDPAAEETRLAEDARREGNWKRWGPYLSERQWGTVREDYSADGDAWGYLPYEHARSRAYRWGEDGLLGISDRQGRLCFALALWNERDPHLKERLFGLTNPEGNHGEDVKEEYFYLDATPTHSYLRAMYRYPLAAFPYERLREEARTRGLADGELELRDTGVFDGNRFVDVVAEYAKASPDDLLVRVTVENRSDETAPVHVLPTLWYRNTWSWGREGEGHGRRPRLALQGPGVAVGSHAGLPPMRLDADVGPDREPPAWLFTENDTNVERLFGAPNPTPYVKDAFDDAVVHGRAEAVNPACLGTKAAAHYRLRLPPGGRAVIRLRLRPETDSGAEAFGPSFERLVTRRRMEADAFYDARFPAGMGEEERRVARQGYAGLLWTKQFFHYVVREWLPGDPAQPAPPQARLGGRNADWGHFHARDVISVCDKWEYPWFAAWDLAFHMIPFARIDPEFAKQQLVLLLREWYQHPNGQIPAYEWALSDVNPPVHAWACWRVYKMSGPRGRRDRAFLARTFQKLVLNFTWWVNRKDAEGRNLFAGGFLGLDNVGVFDRNRPLPTGGRLEQADGTAWMAFFAATMLNMALELAEGDPAYEDMASKFFEHFVAITDAMNGLGGTGLWDEADGYYYDQVALHGRRLPLQVRSMVGLVPLFTAEVIEPAVLERLPGFRRRLDWFLRNRPELARHVARIDHGHDGGHLLLAVPSREQLVRVLRYVLDEEEFLSPHGIRSLSQVHARKPFVLVVDGQEHRVDYVPGESSSRLFGGNSNWRGPVWLPMNYLLIEALERWHHVHGEDLRVECPTGSGRFLNLQQVADEIGRRLTRLVLPDARGRRPCHGRDLRWAEDPAWRDLVLFHEYFDGDTGRGLGATHQTGWTALLVRLLESQAARTTRADRRKEVPVAVG